MHITGFQIFEYSLPVRRPLTLGGSPLHERRGILLRLSTDANVEGWGEASPLAGFSLASLEDAAAQLGALGEQWLGRPVAADWQASAAALGLELENARLDASVRFCLESALLHLEAAARGCSLADVLWPAPASSISVNGLLTGSEGDVLYQAEAMREAGYRAVKLKVGSRPVAEAIRLTRALREGMGSGVAIRLDANRAWSLKEAFVFADGVAACSLEYIEEPLAEASELPTLAAACPLPIALDESLQHMPEGTLQNHAYASAVVLKPTLLGGLAPTMRRVREADALGMACVLSSAFEAGVGLRALIALAAGPATSGVPAGLDTYRWLGADVLEPRLPLGMPKVDVRDATSLRRSIQTDGLRAR